MPNILIIYSTTDGHTLKICRRLKEVIEQQSHKVEVLPINEVSMPELDRYDKIVIGASIRYGKHRPEVYEFVGRYKEILDSRPNAFFSVNVVARKPGKNMPETNPYVRKFLKKSKWKPAELGVFAGKIEYRKYGFLDRNIIRFIMWITKGPTDPESITEFTDWDAVDEFARRVGGDNK